MYGLLKIIVTVLFMARREELIWFSPSPGSTRCLATDMYIHLFLDISEKTTNYGTCHCKRTTPQVLLSQGIYFVFLKIWTSFRYSDWCFVRYYPYILLFCFSYKNDCHKDFATGLVWESVDKLVTCSWDSTVRTHYITETKATLVNGH